MGYSHGSPGHWAKAQAVAGPPVALSTAQPHAAAGPPVALSTVKAQHCVPPPVHLPALCPSPSSLVRGVSRGCAQRKLPRACSSCRGSELGLLLGIAGAAGHWESQTLVLNMFYNIVSNVYTALLVYLVDLKWNEIQKLYALSMHTIEEYAVYFKHLAAVFACSMPQCLQ